MIEGFGPVVLAEAPCLFWEENGFGAYYVAVFPSAVYSVLKAESVLRVPIEWLFLEALESATGRWRGMSLTAKFAF
jgi:hypothetical protein